MCLTSIGMNYLLKPYPRLLNPFLFLVKYLCLQPGQIRHKPQCSDVCLWVNEGKPQTQMSSDCLLVCYQHWCVSNGYVRCQEGLDQAMTRGHSQMQTVKDRPSACTDVCQGLYHLCSGWNLKFEKKKKRKTKKFVQCVNLLLLLRAKNSQ